jgi:hypothetical protein
MKNNDDFLAMQGNVYTLVDKDGYLVRENTEGERKRYALEGEGGFEGDVVTSVNGQTGDVTLNIPKLPDNLVNRFNTFTGDVDYPKFVTTENTGSSLTINFGKSTYLGEIRYYQNPVTTLTVQYQAPSSSNVMLFKDKYVIVKTSSSFTGVTASFKAGPSGFPEWITNKEFVMEPNKIYLIACNFPLATIVELENVK